MRDADSDGTVSKQESLNTMSKVWDARTKKMGIQGDRIKSAEFDEFAKYLRAGA